jgi:hypothetical protein
VFVHAGDIRPVNHDPSAFPSTGYGSSGLYPVSFVPASQRHMSDLLLSLLLTQVMSIRESTVRDYTTVS